MTTTAPQPLTGGSGSFTDEVFGQAWPDGGVPARRRLFLAATAIGLVGAITLPFERLGLAAALVLLASGVLVLTVSRSRGEWFTWVCATLCVGFAGLVVVRDAAWIVVLGVLTSGLLVAAALTRARTVLGAFVALLAWVGAGIRGIPWLGRTLRSLGGTAGSAAVLRTTLVSAAVLLVFGGLLGSGDAIMGHWLSLVLPDVEDTLVVRLFLMVAITGVVLAAAYLAINPPRVDRTETHRPAAHRFEWLAPVLLVDAVFAVFLAAQATAYFGGHTYVRSITGLTYADYVHQGFGQLTVATALTLLVVWAARRKAGTTTTDRRWLGASLGLLCLLTLVVVASALHRMDLYQQAYGFTRLRLLVDAFEGWLGVVVLVVLVAGLWVRGLWLPRLALVSGAAVLLGLGVANPDAWIARHNLDRYAAHHKIDRFYLQHLSADAVPTVLERLPTPARCFSTDLKDDSWASWNLGRARARAAIARAGTTPEQVVCP